MNRRYFIAILSSSKFLQKTINNLILDDDVLLKLYPYPMERAIPVSIKLENEGVEAIIARSGTSYLLREHLGIPVLSIPVSSWDILEAVQEMVLQGGKRIIYPVYKNPIGSLGLIERLYNINLDQKLFTSSAELRDLIEEAAKNGYDGVIGGSLTTGYGSKSGLKTAEIVTTKETIEELIEQAKSIIDINRESENKAIRYQSIIDAAHEGIVAVNVEGIITNINSRACDILTIRDGCALNRNINEIYTNSSIFHVLKNNKPIVGKIEEVNGVSYIVSHFPILKNNASLGVVSIYRDVSNVLKAGNEIKKSIRKKFAAKYSISDIVHKSSDMKNVIDRIRKYSETTATVLIYGETGTGKELVAHSIHRLSKVRNGPFLSMNCAALPEQLLESELFGYEEGSFTGARKQGKAGLFELAENGTIFLDEIGTTTPNLQARLLRVLQEKEIMRIGADYLIPVNVRVIAATNKNLNEEVKMGRIREDLFFRLNVLTIKIPSLRDRREDIPLIIDELVKRISVETNIDPIAIPVDAMSKIVEFSWPGNVRQLENFIQRLMLLCDGKFSYSIFTSIFDEMTESGEFFSTEPDEKARQENERAKFQFLKKRPSEIDSSTIIEALREMKYNKGLTAKRLGISRTSLWHRMKQIEKDI